MRHSFSTVFQTAKIKIDIERSIREIDPKIYGVLMEPIHFNRRKLRLPETGNPQKIIQASIFLAQLKQFT